MEEERRLPIELIITPDAKWMNFHIVARVYCRDQKDGFTELEYDAQIEATGWRYWGKTRRRTYILFVKPSLDSTPWRGYPGNRVTVQDGLTTALDEIKEIISTQIWDLVYRVDQRGAFIERIQGILRLEEGFSERILRHYEKLGYQIWFIKPNK